MNELAMPFIEAWEWVGREGGFPGQVLALVGVVMVVIGGLTWFGSRK